jgi:DNA-binding LacI/PurR family transcriptional regulator
MDNVILLDLDGVMITTKPWESDFILADDFAEFNPKAVTKLNQLLQETGYDIVLSSARRYAHDIDQMNEFFKTRGIEGQIIDYLPLYDLNLRYSRYDEVTRFLMKYRPNNYIVIDDDRSVANLGYDKLMLTDPMIGLI